MTKRRDVPKVSSETTVLDATKLMNAKNIPVVAVVDRDGKVAGFFGERAPLTEFVLLDKKPDEVTVGEIMRPLHRIRPDASRREAVRKIVEYRATRLGVYDGDEFLGWVSLSDLSRVFSRAVQMHHTHSHDELEAREVLCPRCKKAFMEKVTDSEGHTVRWQCPSCKHTL